MPGAILHEATKFRLRAPKAQVGGRIPLAPGPAASLSGLISLISTNHAKIPRTRSSSIELRRIQRIFHPVMPFLLPRSSRATVGAASSAASRHARVTR